MVRRRGNFLQRLYNFLDFAQTYRNAIRVFKKIQQVPDLFGETPAQMKHARSRSS